MHKIKALIIALACTLIIAVSLSLPSYSDGKRESVIVFRVIDGDTLELKDGRTVRLLNINAPEKNTNHAELASNFLRDFQNKSLSAEILGVDKYQRFLVRLYAPEYLNLKLVEQGLASTFLVHESELKQFKNAEKGAIESEQGMWKHSKFYNCFGTKIYSKEEVVQFYNSCNVSLLGWAVKDESRKQYKFSINPAPEFQFHTFSGYGNATDIFWNLKSEVWNNDRDSLYLYDDEGKIAHYEAYGY